MRAWMLTLLCCACCAAPPPGKTASVEHVVHSLYGQRLQTEEGGGQQSSTTDGARPKSKTKLLAKLSASGPARSSSAAGSGGGGPKILYVNAMTFASKPSSLYPRLLALAKGGLDLADPAEANNTPSPMEALQQLQQMFCPDVAAVTAATAAEAATNKGSSKKKSSTASSSSSSVPPMTLVVLDEVDALLRGPNGAVLYHLFEWPRRPASRVVLLAVSNSINLLEQKLPELARRAALPQTILFTTYAAHELKKIAQERCESIYPPITPAAASATAVETKPVVEKQQQKEDEKKESIADEPASVTLTPKKKAGLKSPAAALSVASTAAVAAVPAAAAPASSNTRARRASTLASSACSIADLVSTAPLRAAAARGRKRKADADAAAAAAVASSVPAVAEEAEGEGEDQKQDDSIIAVQPFSHAARSSSVMELENVAPSAAVAQVVKAPNMNLCVTPKKKPRHDSDVAVAPGSAVSVLSSPASSAASFFGGGEDSSSGDGGGGVCLIASSSRDRPIFSEHALEFLCAKVSKGSGDLRKVLEVMRKCVDGLLLEAETLHIVAKNNQATAAAAVTAATASAATATTTEATVSASPSPSPSPSASASSAASSCALSGGAAAPAMHPSLQVSLPLMHGMVVSCLGGVGAQHGLLRSLPTQQKVLLGIGALLSHLHGGREQLTAFPKYYAKFSAHFQLEPLRGADFADLLAALAAHRLIKIDRPPPPRKTKTNQGSGASARSAPSSGGSGRSGSKVRSSSAVANSSALGSIQVNVSLEALTAAFQDDPLMHRLLSKGKALATSILANNRAASEINHADYVMRDVEDP